MNSIAYSNLYTQKYLHAIPLESAKLIHRYFESVYRFEDVKEEKEKPKPIMVIETGGTGEQSIQFDTNYEFNVDEWLKNNPIEINLELEKDGSYKLQRLIGKLCILPTQFIPHPNQTQNRIKNNKKRTHLRI